MRVVEIIIKKRDRQELSKAEIDFFIQGYAKDDIPDYQASAWAMAVLLNGMTARETADLTLAMVHSGKTLDLSGVVPIAVDKHSTGGVGDKTTLVVAPIVRACGLPVGKMSGRGLGFSGGTLDKIESIPGYRSDLSTEEFLAQLGKIGIVLSGQSADLTPADGKLYELRDVTGTVQSIPLIASSVMCKKIAAGAQAIVLDVKVGDGAFMKTLEEARLLAETMVEIGQLAGRKVVALLSDMNQPLGCAVGNALELREAIETLHGQGPADFVEHCLVEAGYMLALGGQAKDEQEGKQIAQAALQEGRGLEWFRKLVQAQGGDVTCVDQPHTLPAASLVEDVPAPRSGYLSSIWASLVGEAVMLLGGGRIKKGDAIDYSVGITVHHNVGDWVEAGQPLFRVHANSAELAAQAKEQVLAAHTWSDVPVDPLPMFYGVID